MFVKENDKRKLINFLLNRWRVIVIFAALERVHIASCLFAKTNNQPLPSPPAISMPHACLQIEVIKQRIISIVPEVCFIDYTYESQAPLDPDDFVEIYVEDHDICIARIESTLKRLQIT